MVLGLTAVALAVVVVDVLAKGVTAGSCQVQIGGHLPGGCIDEGGECTATTTAWTLGSYYIPKTTSVTTPGICRTKFVAGDIHSTETVTVTYTTTTTGGASTTSVYTASLGDYYCECVF